MDKELFSDLLLSVKQAGDILRGQEEAARITTVDYPDVLAIRQKMQLSRENFARMLHVSPRTVQSWEQGKRRPSGAARSLLLIASKNPNIVLEALG